MLLALQRSLNSLPGNTGVTGMLLGQYNNRTLQVGANSSILPTHELQTSDDSWMRDPVPVVMSWRQLR
jgi:hypothetical protein